MNYNIDEIVGISPEQANRLRDNEIMNTLELLEACETSEGKRRILGYIQVSEETLDNYLEQADLMNINGIDGEFAELFTAAGIKSVKELSQRDPADFASFIIEFNSINKLTQRTPTPEMVHDFITQAQELDD